MELSTEILKRAKTAINIWTILTVCCAFFLVVPYISELGVVEPGADAGQERLQTLVFIFLSVTMGITSLFIRFYLLSEDRLRKLATDLRAKDTAPEKLVARFVQHWISMNLLAWGLNESIASFGVIIAKLTHSAGAALPLALAGLILNLLMVPRLDRVISKAGLLSPP